MADPDESPITWRQEDTDRWLEAAEQRERTLTPVLGPLLAAAAPRRGERVLDVGCGTGPTTAAVADAVLPGGEVVGLDLAPELVAVAARRVGRDGVSWLVGDATAVELPRAHFDLVLSRFGTMFFADPVAAFAHLAEATRPGGRLAMAVWPPRDEVEMFTLPYEAARRALDRAGAGYDEPSPSRGPFALGVEARVRDVLAAAGWGSVGVESVTVRVPLTGPDGDLAVVVRGLLDRGHAGVLLEDRPEEVRAAAERDLAAQLAERRAGDGVRLSATFRVVTAVLG